MAEELGAWILNYLPEEGGRYTGTLSVSDEMVAFASLYESSNATIVKAIFADVGAFAASGGHSVYRYSNDKEARVDLPVSEIASVEAAKKGLMHRAVISMYSGEAFVFDYGMLSVKKLMAVIETLTADR